MKTRYSKRLKKNRSKRMKTRYSKRLKKNRSKRMKKSRHTKKLKLFGGSSGAAAAPAAPGTPRECPGESHYNTVSICEPHYDKLWAPSEGKCPFWAGIREQLEDRGTANTYDDIETKEIMPCACCDVKGVSDDKECAVFRIIRYCVANPPCPGILQNVLCSDCACCNSI